jgi:ribonuclease-3
VILERFHFPRIASILKDSEFVNYKSLLIEWMQSHSLQPPEYVVVNESGPGHQKVFETEVLLNGKVYGKGVAVSKKKAEQEAAAVALQKVQQEGIHET